jgi:hypothetical protein
MHYIIAGSKDNCLNYRSFNPAIELEGKAPGHLDTLNIDINNDNNNDIQIECNKSRAAFIYPLTTRINRIELNVTDFSYYHYSANYPNFVSTGNIFKYTNNDTIKNNSIWSPSLLYSGSIPIIPYGNYTLTDSILSLNTWFNAIHQYIGIRFIDDVDTLYGWVGISVIGYSHIIVHDCSYQSK